MAVLAAVCAKVPEAKLGIIFLPMVTFTAGNVSDAQCVQVVHNVCVCVHSRPWVCTMHGFKKGFSCNVDTHL